MDRTCGVQQFIVPRIASLVPQMGSGGRGNSLPLRLALHPHPRDQRSDPRDSEVSDSTGAPIY